MSFTTLSSDLDIIAGLDDEPNDVGGLSATEFKAKFDEAANTIKAYINSTLLAEIGGTGGAGNIGISTISGVTASTVQAALAALRQQIVDASVGTIPDASISAAKLADLAVTSAKLGALAVTAAKMADNAVETAKIKDGNVTTAKLSNSAITAAKIAAGAVELSKIAAAAFDTSPTADSAKLLTSGVIQAAISTLQTSITSLSTGKANASHGSQHYIGGTDATVLKFTDTAVSTFTSDSTYTGYGYKAVITLTGVTAGSFAEVIFGMTEINSKNYAPICETGDGTVTIYAKVNTAITIPTIMVWK